MEVSSASALPAGAARLRRAAILGALIVNAGALMTAGIQPLVLGALVADGRLTEAQLGPVATIEMVGLSLGALVAPRLLANGVRLFVALACLILLLIDLSISQLHSFETVLAGRAVAGLLAGTALAGATMVLVRHPDPARLNGIGLATSALPQILFAYLLPTRLIPSFGSAAGFYALGCGAFAAMVAAFFLEDAAARAERAANEAIRWSWRTATLFGAIIVANAGMGAAWGYSERVASLRGLSEAAIGTAIAGALFSQVLGALLITFLGRVPFRLAIPLGWIILGSIIVALSSVTSPAGYIALLFGFGALSVAIQPWTILAAIDLDPTRATAVLIPGVTIVGIGLGPTVIASTVGSLGLINAINLAAALPLSAACVTAVLFSTAGRQA